MNFTKSIYASLLGVALLVFFVAVTLVPSPSLPPKQVTVHARGLQFEPTLVRGWAGRPIHLRLINNGYVSHNLEVPDLDVETDMIPPGSSTEVTLRIDEPGRYRFICDIASHLGAGMEGRLVVR